MITRGRKPWPSSGELSPCLLDWGRVFLLMSLTTELPSANLRILLEDAFAGKQLGVLSLVMLTDPFLEAHDPYQHFKGPETASK